MGAIGRACFGDLWLRAAPALDVAFRTGARAELLAALVAGTLDVAVYPGPPAAGIATTLLCDDQLVVLLRVDHPLAHLAAIDLVAARHVLVPVEGDGGDLRRLLHALVPGAPPITELPLRAVELRLRRGDEIAVAPAALADEAGDAIARRPIADADTTFPVQIGWVARVSTTDFRHLLSALGV